MNPQNSYDKIMQYSKILFSYRLDTHTQIGYNQYSVNEYAIILKGGICSHVSYH